ncbi:MAG: HxsD-like protein [Minicystis sp.]
MIELRFHHDLYDAAALDEAVKVYGAYGTADLAREGDASVVRVTVSAETAAQGIDERTLAAELGNYALGLSIDKARTIATEAAQ